MISILRVAHAQITVPPEREAEARDFYLALLGLKEIPKPESLRGRGGFWIDGGGIQVHVAIETGVDRLATKAHLAYEVDDLEVTRKLLEAKGFAISAGPGIPGYRRFETRDPFGNRIEFMQRA